MERWTNKVAIVTGASSGIGAACCKALLGHGLIVVGLARRLERMEKDLKLSLPAEQQTRFYAVKCDLSKEQDILQAFKWTENKFGGVDVLVNNAGVAVPSTQIVAENNTDKLKNILDVNVMGVALCTREAFRSMKKRNFDGHVVIINSVLGHQVLSMPNVNLNMYPPSKFALTAMTEVLRQEFMMNKTKVKVTSVSPGLADTEIVNLSRLPGMPYLKAEDVADAVVYCLQTPPHVQIHELEIRAI